MRKQILFLIIMVAAIAIILIFMAQNTRYESNSILCSHPKNVFEVTEKICSESKYMYDRLEMTGMWANMLKKGESHPPHTHSNNVFSGVYFLETGAPIQFFDPRPQASVLQPNLEYTTFDNSSMMQFSSQKGMGLIFPSWLQHWVPTTHKDRISISWNIILRGNYGQPDTLQNSHI